MYTVHCTSCLLAESEDQHLKVLEKAFNVYMERSNVRGELWAQFDVHDALHNIGSKFERAKYAAQNIEKANPYSQEMLREEFLDSVVDLINYAVFAHRHVTGSKP